MHVSICIVGFRNAPDLRECLEALAELDYPSFEVVICENGGPEAHVELHQTLPGVMPGGQPVTIILADRNLGYAGGVNACIRRSRTADAWWILNPDTRPDRESLRCLVDRFEDGDSDLVGGILLDEQGRVRSLGGRWRTWLARPETLEPRHVAGLEDHRQVEALLSYVSGASILVGRRFVDEVGMMREDYFLYCEEVEWALRGIKQGMRLGFAPDARVVHKQGTTTGAAVSVRQRPKLPIFLDERNKMLLTRDHYPGRLPIVAVALFAQILARFGRRGAWAQMAYALQGWSAGLMNRRGPPRWLQP